MLTHIATRTRRTRLSLAVAMLAVLVLSSLPATAKDANALTFQKVVEYLDLEVKEDRLLKLVSASSTAFTLGDDQITLLRSKGASDRLIEAMQKKSGSPDDALAGTSDVSDFVIILDCSGSMKDKSSDGQTKWDAAKQAALDLVAAVPDDRQLAFVVYGHNKEQECRAVAVLRPLAPISAKSRAALTGRINQLQPVGNTPIALSLDAAAEELKAASGLAKVILITDGVETCQGNPVKSAAQLAANANLKDGLTVVGFGLKQNESAAVARIAEAGKGQFHDARNAADLVKAVKVVEESIAVASAEPELVKADVKPSSELTNPAPLEVGKYASGRLGEKKSHYFTMQLPAGEYVAVIDALRSDKKSGYIRVNCQLDGKEVCYANPIDKIARAAKPFKVEGGTYVLSVSNGASSIFDYHFMVVGAADKVPSPYIGQGANEFRPYTVGKSVALKLDPKDLKGHAAFFHTKLEPGDYVISYTFQSPKAKGNYGASIEPVNQYGMLEGKSIGSQYSSSGQLAIQSKLIVADDPDLRFRVQCTYDAPIEGTLVITKAGADAEPK